MAEMIKRLILPARMAAADRGDRGVDLAIGLGHPFKCRPVDHEVGPKQVEQRE
jgi:hypothetical protein